MMGVLVVVALGQGRLEGCSGGLDAKLMARGLRKMLAAL